MESRTFSTEVRHFLSCLPKVRKNVKFPLSMSTKYIRFSPRIRCVCFLGGIWWWRVQHRLIYFSEVFVEVFGVERWYLLGFGGCFGFQVSVHGRHTPPTPLERGDWDAVFLLVMRVLSVIFPLLRGDEGVSYGEKLGKGWDVSRSWAWCWEEVSVGFWWEFLILGVCARTSHTPAPLKRGDLDAVFVC